MLPLKLSLTPRGFFGRPGATTLRPKVRPFAGRASNRPQTIEIYQPAQNELVADPEVMRLYRMWLDAEPYTRSYDYRREVMQVALKAFGTPSFLDWVIAQQMSPAYGEYHQRFLVDTVRYIETGKRELPMRTWQRMVTYQDDKVSDYDPGGYLKQFFGVARFHPDSVVDMRRDNEIASLSFTLHRWLSQPTGLDDLLNCLYLLFGELN